MEKKWRLIPLINTSGQIQMAIDNWLLHQHKLGNIPPTLRFYTWQPSAISLGYNQKKIPDFWHNLTWNNTQIDIVKRPSGGRAVLHQGDLTYMIVTSGLKGNRKQVYQQLCEFLIQGWRNLGIELYYGHSGRGYIHNNSCFSTATDADLITIDGVKFIGSAQTIQGYTMLQHGSMNLFNDPSLYYQVFNQEINQIKFAQSPNKDQLILTIIDTLIKSAQNCFDIEFYQQDLSDQEKLEISHFIVQ